MEIIAKMQNDNAATFTPKAVYDGRKNMFSIKELSLGPKSIKQASFPLIHLRLSLRFSLFDIV